MQYDSSITANCIVWISSIPSSEVGASNRMLQSIEAVCEMQDFPIRKYKICSHQQMIDCMNDIKELTKSNGLKPILHFDMHGDEQSGVLIENEKAHMSWEDFTHHLRDINSLTGNNLLVIMACCHGMESLKSIKTKEVTPYFILIAPLREVFLGQLEDNIPVFYRSLLSNEDIIHSFRSHLSEIMELYHSEYILFEAICDYITRYCRGKEKKNRRETLLTEIINSDNDITRDLTKREIRILIKDFLEFDTENFQQYADAFLGGRKFGFTFEDILLEIKRRVFRSSS